MLSPFTTTFSKIPDYTYIPTIQADEIIDNFNYYPPAESVYKITGVRGSGKTVLLAKIEEEYLSEQRKKSGWLVYRLSPSRDMLRQLAASLSKEGFLKGKRKTGINISATTTVGSLGINSEPSDIYTDLGVEIDEMLKVSTDKGKKILIGIDEVSKTSDMIVFAAEFGKWLRSGYAVYLVCTGLYENIEQIYNVRNLTFFRRATTVKTEPLNTIRMAEMYKNKLEVSNDKAKELARITKGYPYAFQELGVLYFKKKQRDSFEDIVEQLKAELFSYAYEKIWEEMSREDRTLVSLILDKDEYKRDDVVHRMEKPGNYSTYRDRLLRRGIITARQGYISLALPYFNEYVREYGSAN